MFCDTTLRSEFMGCIFNLFESFFFPWKGLFLLLLGSLRVCFFGGPFGSTWGSWFLIGIPGSISYTHVGVGTRSRTWSCPWVLLGFGVCFPPAFPLWLCFESLLVSLCPWSREMTVTFCCHCPTTGKPVRGYRLRPFVVGDWFQHLLLVFRKFRLRRVLPPIHYHLQAVRCSCKRTNISHSQLHKTFIWHHKHEWKMNLHCFCFCLCCLCLQPQKVGCNLPGLFWGLCNFVATIYKLVPLKKRWFMRIWR